MLRLFLLVQLLLVTIYASQGDYSSCVAKIKDSNTIQNNSLYIPVKGYKRLVYSKEKPDAKIFKYDPFLSLYLIKDRDTFAYPFSLNTKLQLSTALVTNSNAKEGKILKNEVGLNRLAYYSVKSKRVALITTSCCSLEGIVTPHGVIQKEYIQRFLSSTPSSYGDIGIRVKNKKGVVVVSSSNPFLKGNLFCKEDLIVAFDGKSFHSASIFMRKVLFSKVGSLHSVKIKRDGKFFRFKVIIGKRFGGGAVSDTFLEDKGIYFDKTLHIIKLAQIAQNYGLFVGDHLLKANGVTVKNQEELMQYVENFKEFSLLLFERKNFQFFVKIK